MRPQACLTIACSLDSFASTAALLREERVFGAFGVHPLNAEQWSAETQQRVEDLLQDEKAVPGDVARKF